MYKKLTRFLFVPLTACFCMIAISYAQDEGGGEGNDKVDVCHFLPNGKFITQRLPEKTALKQIEGHPHEWILGKCDDVISPS